MFKVNEYFDGNVKSLGFDNSAGRFTVGVMAAGSYTFGTNCKEEMTLISGQMAVKLPGETALRSIAIGETFAVAADVKFEVQIGEAAAYLCKYL